MLTKLAQILLVLICAIGFYNGAYVQKQVAVADSHVQRFDTDKVSVENN